MTYTILGIKHTGDGIKMAVSVASDGTVGFEWEMSPQALASVHRVRWCGGDKRGNAFFA